MTKHEKYIAALTRAVKTAKNPDRLKEKIKAIKTNKARAEWLAQ